MNYRKYLKIMTQTIFEFYVESEKMKFKYNGISYINNFNITLNPSRSRNILGLVIDEGALFSSIGENELAAVSKWTNKYPTILESL